MNFTAPMTLEAFGESNGVNGLSKSAFPYELWANIQEIMACTKFPPYNDFKSSLTRPGGDKWEKELETVCNELTENIQAKEKWMVIEKFFQLPKSDLGQFLSLENGQFCISKKDVCSFVLHTSPRKYKFSKDYFGRECLTMLDYLREYNLIDVRILSKSIMAYAKGFWDQFKINVHSYMSLPAVAEAIAYKNYDKESDPIYTFSDDFRWLNEEVRSALNGGMTLVMHRLLHLTKDERVFPEPAYVAPNGQNYEKMLFLDYNSLYPYAVKNELPTGPGLFLRRKHNSTNFKLHGMLRTGKKSSMEALEWLEFLQSSNIYKGRILHAYNKGEQKLKGYFVDGFLSIKNEAGDDYIYAFDYNGCYWHDCPHKCMVSRQSEEEIASEKERTEILKAAADEYIVMTSCKWMEFRKNRSIQSIDYPFVGQNFIRENDIIQG